VAFERKIKEWRMKIKFMKKLKYLFGIVILLFFIGISVMIFNKNNSINVVEINDEVLNSWEKVYISLKEKSLNQYYFKNEDLHNGDIFLLQRKNQGLMLKDGDKVLINLTIIPDGLSHTVVGYILDEKFTEIFSEPVSDKLSTSLEIKSDGEYVFCIVGSNANYITIKNGVIIVD